MLHVAAGIRLCESGATPLLVSVQTFAAELREEMLCHALEAAACLGAAPKDTSQAESDLRVFAHDLTHRGHDKDYRCFAALCPKLWGLFRSIS